MTSRTEHQQSKNRLEAGSRPVVDVPARCHRGACAHHAGRAAEEQVKAAYLRRGLTLRVERWRGRAGEIDLIFSDGASLVFVEVKQSASFDRAIRNLRPAQLRRIFLAAEEFLACMPGDTLTESRVDLAVVDGQGAMHIIENLMLD